MLSNTYFLAKFRFDTAENEPAKNLQNFTKFVNFADPNPLTLTPKLVVRGGDRRSRASSICFSVRSSRSERSLRFTKSSTVKLPAFCRKLGGNFFLAWLNELWTITDTHHAMAAPFFLYLAPFYFSHSADELKFSFRLPTFFNERRRGVSKKLFLNRVPRNSENRRSFSPNGPMFAARSAASASSARRSSSSSCFRRASASAAARASSFRRAFFLLFEQFEWTGDFENVLSR